MDDTTTTLAFPEGMRIHHATKAKAEKLDAMLRAEYPAIRLVCEASADDTPSFSIVGRSTGTEDDEEGDERSIAFGPKVPALADVLEECEANGISLEMPEPEDEEPKLSGSVVPETYRQRYRAESSNGQTCGDWLAEWLVAQTHHEKGFNVEDFTALLVVNGIDLRGKWGQLPTSGQPGWVGRYRMNGRQVLEKIAAKTGKVKDHGGNEHQLPEDALAILQAKHAKWLAKEAKAEAAATEALKTVTEEAPTPREIAVAGDPPSNNA